MESAPAETPRHFEVVAERLATKILALTKGTNKRLYRLDTNVGYFTTDINTSLPSEVDAVVKERGTWPSFTVVST